MAAQKVLVIDDDAHLRESLVEVLDLEGFACLQAGNAKSPAELLEAMVQERVLSLWIVKPSVIVDPLAYGLKMPPLRPAHRRPFHSSWEREGGYR